VVVVVPLSVVVGCSVDVVYSVVVVEVVGFKVDEVGLEVVVVVTAGGLVPPWHSGTFCGKSQTSNLGLKK